MPLTVVEGHAPLLRQSVGRTPYQATSGQNSSFLTSAMFGITQRLASKIQQESWTGKSNDQGTWVEDKNNRTVGP